jgi:hypothetical protein
MIVVSNTSPISNLAAVGQLTLLRQLYGRVIIPQSVYDEFGDMPSSVGVVRQTWRHKKDG